MIAPGTLVQYIGDNPRLRHNGIYCVGTEEARAAHFTCRWCETECSVLFLRDAPNGPFGDVVTLRGKTFRLSLPGWVSCRFRLIAGPLTEADRLELSEPPAPTKGPVRIPIREVK